MNVFFEFVNWAYLGGKTGSFVALYSCLETVTYTMKTHYLRESTNLLFDWATNTDVFFFFAITVCGCYRHKCWPFLFLASVLHLVACNEKLHRESYYIK